MFFSLLGGNGSKLTSIFQLGWLILWASLPNTLHVSGQIIATSAEVTPNDGLGRETSPNHLNSGLEIIVICPDVLSFGKPTILSLSTFDQRWSLEHIAEVCWEAPWQKKMESCFPGK